MLSADAEGPQERLRRGDPRRSRAARAGQTQEVRDIVSRTRHTTTGAIFFT